MRPPTSHLRMLKHVLGDLGVDGVRKHTLCGMIKCDHITCTCSTACTSTTPPSTNHHPIIALHLCLLHLVACTPVEELFDRRS